MKDPQPLPVVVGTAGHIDHGKSALIEALTGVHPDRWEEERRRGITLDLGYAQTSWEDGLELGFVDVPGHERLVRKMVAGATGMGAALLVVACDDGVMPQTREHFEVLRMLGVDRGLVALSKADLADEETRELVREEVRELVADTPWEGCPMIPCSAVSREGLPELRAALRELALGAAVQEDGLHAFRMPVQRAFALHGAGTVATGVCASGRLRTGDTVESLPGGGRSRVRRIQVHGHGAEEARPGLRTALNLPEFTADRCGRGKVLAAPGSLRSGALLRVRLRPLSGAPPLEHGAEVQVLAGTCAVSGRVYLPPEQALAETLADLQLAEEVALVPGDRLILRRPSPARNLAAGRFLVFARRRLRRRDRRERERLQALAEALDDPPALLVATLELAGESLSAAELAARLGWLPAAAARILEECAATGRIRPLSGDRYLAAAGTDELGRAVLAALRGFRRRSPHRLRIPLTVLRGALGKQRARLLEELEGSELAALGLRRRPGTAWELLEVEAPPECEERAARLLAALRAGGLSPLPVPELLPGEEVEDAVELLVDREQALQLPNGQLYATEVVVALRDALIGQLRAGEADIPALRDRFHTTRKFLMPLLEFFDQRGVTARRGPKRILRDPEAPLH